MQTITPKRVVVCTVLVYALIWYLANQAVAPVRQLEEQIVADLETNHAALMSKRLDWERDVLDALWVSHSSGAPTAKDVNYYVGKYWYFDDIESIRKWLSWGDASPDVATKLFDRYLSLQVERVNRLQSPPMPRCRDFADQRATDAHKRSSVFLAYYPDTAVLFGCSGAGWVSSKDYDKETALFHLGAIVFGALLSLGLLYLAFIVRETVNEVSTAAEAAEARRAETRLQKAYYAAHASIASLEETRKVLLDALRTIEPEFSASDITQAQSAMESGDIDAKIAFQLLVSRASGADASAKLERYSKARQRTLDHTSQFTSSLKACEALRTTVVNFPSEETEKLLARRGDLDALVATL